MSKYQFEIASELSEEDLRGILRQTEMPGNISLSFRREPNFFIAEKSGNLSSDVVAVRDLDKNKLVGVGARSIRKNYVTGKAGNIGYLSALRGLPEILGGTLLARGYRFLKNLHKKGEVPFYYTTILDENSWAKEMLTSKRCGLPTYEEQGVLVTHMIPLYKRRWRKNNTTGLNIVRVGRVPYLIRQVYEAVNDFNRYYDYSAVVSLDSLKSPEQFYPGFSTENLFAVFRDGHITATLGVWDQSHFKQTIVTGYKGFLRYLAPLSSLGSKLNLMPELPKIGGSFSTLYACFVSLKQGYEADLAVLLSEVLRLNSKQGYYYLLAGSPKGSPIERIFESQEAFRITSTLYRVYWEEDVIFLPKTLVPYPEIATL